MVRRASDSLVRGPAEGGELCVLKLHPMLMKENGDRQRDRQNCPDTHCPSKELTLKGPVKDMKMR